MTGIDHGRSFGKEPSRGAFLLLTGDTETSIEKANEALELESDHVFAFLALMDAYTLKDHPRYLALLKRIGLDDESVTLLNASMSFN